MSKYLHKVTNYGDSTISSIIQDNLIEFFDWAIMDIGGFNNVSIPQTGVYGGDRHKLRLVNDPRYTSGQVWEAFRGNWVWQSGLASTDQPNTLLKLKPDAATYPNAAYKPGVSGVFVGGTFQPTSGVGTYAHHIDYPNGRVVFDTAISTTSEVTAEFSYKQVKIVRATDDFFREVQYRSERADEDFTLAGSGDWSQLSETRLQLPIIAIEVLKGRNNQPYALGTSSHFVNTEVLYHVLSEEDYERDKLLDIISLQDENVITLFDSDKIGRDGVFPLDHRGMTNTGAKIYPDLVKSTDNGGFPYTALNDTVNMRMLNSRVSVSESINPNLHHGVVRMTNEVII